MKVVRADERSAHQRPATRGADRIGRRVRNGLDGAERIGNRLEVWITEERKGAAIVDGAVCVLDVKAPQLLWRRHSGRWPHEYSIEEREHRGVEPDSQGQCQRH